ncbi:unnamed protein product [Ectocarpus sp. 12 AP-2014]
MYPIVFKAYQANVPTEMSEKEFWTKYIQSAYFNRDRGGGDGGGNNNNSSSAISGNKRKSLEAGGGDGGQDDMFLRFAAQEAEREKREKAGEEGGAGGGKRRKNSGSAAGGTGGGRLESGSVDPMVDLTSQWGDHHAREVDDSDPTEELSEAANKRKEVVGKFNRHARLVMQPPDGGGGGGAAGRRPALVDSAASATDMPELRLREEVAREKLDIAHKNRYRGGGGTNGADSSGGPASNGGSSGAISAGSLSRPQSPRGMVVEAVTLAEAKAQLGPGFSILGERPRVSGAVASPGQAMSALKECTREASRGVGDAFHLQGYPEDFIGSMHRHFQIVGELLRHFYASLDRPKSDAGAAAKLDRLETRMNSKYKELTEERRRLPRNADGNRLSAVIKPLLDCLDHAFLKLEESKTRKGSVGGGGGAKKPSANTGGWFVPGDDDDDDDDDDDSDSEDDQRGGWSVVR